MMRQRIKICCIADAAEAALAMRHGASALGLVTAMPSGPGVITDDAARDIAAIVPPGVATFLLTCAQQASALIMQQRHIRATTLQIVDALTHGTYSDLREALPGVGLVQVIHVQDSGALDEALAVAADVDAILLDSGNTRIAVKELGGTGRTHDWAVSRRIVEQCGKPVYLAGGLNPANVRRAVDEVRPFGIDICSGVRTGGRLDEAKLAALVAELR